MGPPSAGVPTRPESPAPAPPPGRALRALRLGVAGSVVIFAMANPWLSWPCPLRTVLHVPCPTCGMTRATLCLCTLDFAGAARLHPLVFVTLPVLALASALEAHGYVQYARWGTVARHRGVSRALTALLVVLLALWIARFFGALGGPAPI